MLFLMIPELYNFIISVMANFFQEKELPLRKVSSRIPQFITAPPSIYSHEPSINSSREGINETTRKLTLISKLVLMHM